MYECAWFKLCLTILFLVHMLQALYFWIAVMPRSLGLSVVIEGIRIVIANCKTCLIRGRYTLVGIMPPLTRIACTK